MNRQDIDALVKQMNVDTATGAVDQRVQSIVVRLLGDLFQAIEDLDIQASEVWKGLEYFTDAGQANELGLLAAGLGLEHYLDLRADEADAKKKKKIVNPAIPKGNSFKLTWFLVNVLHNSEPSAVPTENSVNKNITTLSSPSKIDLLNSGTWVKNVAP